MNRLFLTFVLLLSFVMCSGQITKSGELFSTVTTVQGNVVFIKEIVLNNNASKAVYEKIKSWGNENYDKDPFISSIYFDDKNEQIVAQSRVELLLPENLEGVRKKIIMRYGLSCFMVKNKCIFEVKDISYLYKKKENLVQTIVRANELITPKALTDDLEFKQNLIKSTLYFFNNLELSLEKTLGSN